MPDDTTTHPPTTQHNYRRLLDAFLATLTPNEARVLELDVRHDPWCDVLTVHDRPRYCNCKPTLWRRVG